MSERKSGGSGPPPTRHGHDAYEVVSSLQKAVRRSQPEQAAYWALELAMAGLGPWCWKRLKVVAIEDCSPEATGLVSDIEALHEQWKADKDNLLAVVRAAVAVAIAPKNRVSDWLLMLYSVDDAPRLEVPDHALDVHTRRGRARGRAWRHFWDESGRLVQWTGDLAELEADVASRAAPHWVRGEQLRLGDQ